VWEQQMRGVPSDVDWSVLCGAEVTHICIGQYQLQVRCIDDVNDANSVTFAIEEGEYEHRSTSGLISDRSEWGHDLVELLGARIAEAAREDESTLRLKFDNGRVLRLIDSDSVHDSFDVMGRGLSVIV
jgi:hypothetical protein